MAILERRHIERAIEDVTKHGDNDTLPFDIDTRFIGEMGHNLSEALFNFGQNLEKKSEKDLKSTVYATPMPSEKLLAPAGYSGFRMTTKIHPYWNLYFNSLSIAIAERHERVRDARAHSYRFCKEGALLFDQTHSWRNFLEQIALELESDEKAEVVVQTDISSFYDHVYHHRIKNFLDDLLNEDSNIPSQVENILPKFAGGRSFGLPIGGQGARIVAEVLLASVDRSLATEGIRWHRYVDDFVLLANDHRDAYRVLGILARTLSDLGLSLNRTKTSVLSLANYREYVSARLGLSDEETKKLVEVDLHFDPYSDTADEDYEELRETVEHLDMERLLARELEKSQADTFVISQIGRSLHAMEPVRALALAKTLLEPKNLHSFRASWSSIMRGVARIRDCEEHTEVAVAIDAAIEDVALNSSHLLSVDTNCLHFLRLVRGSATQTIKEFVATAFNSKRQTVRRACVDCWIEWQDRERFLALRNDWQMMSEPEQRLLWLGAAKFGDDGHFFRQQERKTLGQLWAASPLAPSYITWVDNVAPTQ